MEMGSEKLGKNNTRNFVIRISRSLFRLPRSSEKEKSAENRKKEDGEKRIDKKKSTVS